MVKMSFDVENPDGSGFLEENGPVEMAFVAGLNENGELVVSNQFGGTIRDLDAVMIALAQAVKYWTGCLTPPNTEAACLEKNLEFLKEFARLLVIDAASDEWINEMDEDAKDGA